jgi:hypothetical protein
VIELAHQIRTSRARYLTLGQHLIRIQHAPHEQPRETQKSSRMSDDGSHNATYCRRTCLKEMVVWQRWHCRPN